MRVNVILLTYVGKTVYRDYKVYQSYKHLAEKLRWSCLNEIFYFVSKIAHYDWLATNNVFTRWVVGCYSFSISFFIF